MISAEIKITIIKTDSGRLRIAFDDGGSYPIPDVAQNIALISALETELDYAYKKRFNSKPSKDE